MSQRISLTRIIALNWYGFRQLIDVADNVLISGSFGTGKSALLDLIQYVMLGDGWRANRAAAGSSKGRNLVGYCLGDTNQKTRTGEPHYLRDSGVTVIALEFTRPTEHGQEPKRETWGIRFEYSSPQVTPKRTYFCIPARMEYADFATEEQMLEDDIFRTWVRHQFGNECLFSDQKPYLAEMATNQHLYFDQQAFKRTFPKAIAFELEDNVEKFIREFILEENSLDVRDVRKALLAYEDTKKRLQNQENEAEYLKRICEYHEHYENSRREAAILRHIYILLELQQQEELLDRHSDNLRRLDEEHATSKREFEEKQKETERFSKLIENTNLLISRDPSEVAFNQHKLDHKRIKNEFDSLNTVLATTNRILDGRHQNWIRWLEHGESLQLDGLTSVLAIDENLLRSLRSGPENKRLKDMISLAERFQQIWSNIQGLLFPLTSKKTKLTDKLMQLKADRECLETGQAPGSFPAFQAMRTKLGNRVEQLGRLIEVKSHCERWWPALELYLESHRYAIILSDENDYDEALQTLRQTNPLKGEREALINPSEVRQLRTIPQQETLWDKVEISHPLARRYIEHLLGEVVCVEKYEELEAASVSQAITPDGHLKICPLRRRLNGSGVVPLTLGKLGLQRMRARLEEEFAKAEADLGAINRLLNDVNAWLDSGKKYQLGNGTLPDRAGELTKLPELEEQLQALNSTIELLSTPERTERLAKLNEWKSQQKAIDDRLAVILNESRHYDTKAQPERDRIETARSKVLDLQLDVQVDRAKLGRDFSGILDTELQPRRDDFKSRFTQWTECFKEVSNSTAKSTLQTQTTKAERNRERRELATVRDEQNQLRHPNYQHEFSIEDDDNQAWRQRLQVLEGVGGLEESRKQAESCQAVWEKRLEENVLKELKQRTDEAERTIRLLDKHLSQPVGKNRYRISCRRDQAGFSSAWRLLDTGFAESDPLMAAISENEVQQAKNEMMKAINEIGESKERAHRLLDYRNYHHYDIEVVPADNPNAPPISLGKSGRNLSGGENQAPFFISMLAAFRRVYDKGNRQSQKSQQLGLVVMDEAFSKLSGDGIEDCLALAESFQLQLVMAFPPEKLGVMVPHSQTVVVCSKEIESAKDGYVTRIDNIPIIMTMGEALDTFS